MPNQSHSGWTGIPWHYCDRCGFPYPVSQLVKQSGLIVCREKCWDNPQATLSVDRRLSTIAQVLSEPNDGEPELADILKNEVSDDEDAGG